MNLQITGRLILIEPTKQVSEKFQTREFVLDITEGEYPNFAKMQVTQKKCPVLDSYKVGDAVTVNFNIKGRKWEKNGKTDYFTTIEAWKIEKAGTTDNNYTPEHFIATPIQPEVSQPQNNNTVEDLPF